MLADALTKGGLNVPPIEGENADKLLGYLHPGSSVSNPIDFLATGTAEQLGIIIDYCEHKFDHIDARWWCLVARDYLMLRTFIMC